MARTIEELKEKGLGHGAFDIGYGRVAAGDLIEGGVNHYSTGQVLEVFHDGECLVEWDDPVGKVESVKWRFVRKLESPQ